MGLPSNQDCISQIVELDIPNELATANNNTVDPEVKSKQQQQEKRPVLKCPRCDSSNTKFCYYNNYSKMQPRHFCRACKRHWTAGGTLRNVPVGGARRNKRAKTNHDENNSTDHQNDDNEQRVHSVPAIDTAVFPDIYRLLMSQPPLLPHVGRANENLYSGGTSLLNLGSESMLGFMDGDYGTNSAAQPPNFVNSWDHAWNLV